MAAAEERREEDSSIQIGLLDASQNPTTSEEGHSELQLNQSLQRLENFLRFFGFCQYSPLSFTFSWLAFIIVGLLVPLLIIIEFSGDSDRYQIKSFELEILVFNSVAASISLLCISHNLRKYGLRKFLFVDRYQGHLSQFRPKYVERIHVRISLSLSLYLSYTIYSLVNGLLGCFDSSRKYIFLISHFFFCLAR